MAELQHQEVYEVVTVAQADDQAFINVMHYVGRQVQPGANPAFGIFLLDWQKKWTTSILPNVSATYEVLYYEIRHINDAFSRGATTTGGIKYWFGYDLQDLLEAEGDEVGQLPGPHLPTFCAVNFRKSPEKRDRKYRGSLRLGPIPEADTEADDQNVITDVAHARHEALAETLNSSIDVADGGDFYMDPVVASRKGAWENLDAGFDAWTSPIGAFRPSQLVSSQVSRKRSFKMA